MAQIIFVIDRGTPVFNFWINMIIWKKYKRYKTLKLSLRLINYILRHEGVWESRCIDPRFLHLGTSWRWVFSFTPLPLYPPGKEPQYLLNSRLGGRQSRSGRLGAVNIFYLAGTRTPILGRPARSHSLYRPRYRGLYLKETSMNNYL
jgi:hypothetical protein